MTENQVRLIPKSKQEVIDDTTGAIVIWSSLMSLVGIYGMTEAMLLDHSIGGTAFFGVITVMGVINMLGYLGLFANYPAKFVAELTL